MTLRVESTRCVYEVSFNREKSFTQMKILDYLAVYMFISYKLDTVRQNAPVGTSHFL